MLYAPVGDSRQGFTLVELSIVLVIIGLIVGGILAGRDLIHGAELRAVVSEEEKLVTAVNTFKLKFNCIPGDCANATDYFGQAATCDGSVSLTDTSGTCNGNGNSIICQTNDPLSCDNSAYKNLFAAHHLHLAQLVGFPLATPNNTTVMYAGFHINIPGSNIFASNALSGLGWDLRSIQAGWIGTSFNGGATKFCGTYTSDKNELFLGGASINGPLGDNDATVPGVVYMSGFDGYSIDKKIDDGLPGTGYVVSPYYSATNQIINGPACNASYQTAVTYNINTNRAEGGLVFMVNF